MKKIDKIIQIIKENITMVANAPSTGGAFGASSPSPTAGVDSLIPGMRRRRNGKVDYRMNKKYKEWVKKLEEINNKKK